MENLVMELDRKFWLGKKVLITGHTGFKGGWLSIMLKTLGAELYGISLPSDDDNLLYNTATSKIEYRKEIFCDVADSAIMEHALTDIKPEIVFHLAAQPLVRESYHSPLNTFTTNTMGTLNVLEAGRKIDSLKAFIIITTDKVYRNDEEIWPLRENEQLGAADPYSSSKACAELICSSYYKSFFKKNNVGISTVRAGNVIGGGDWAKDRLIPDFLKSASSNASFSVRMPNAVRPWQHVLEPLFGYITLAQNLFERPNLFSEAYNFGPDEGNTIRVSELLTILGSEIPSAAWQYTKADLPEAMTLKLDSSRAKRKLSWYPKLNIIDAVKLTAKWHNEYSNGADMLDITIGQVENYLNDT
ncbi:CDP-glucose 4,6-dehydratase [Amylibacter sp.]|nr:CDP-glucose 4,6-dehydratase [Amylibacter sp.]